MRFAEQLRPGESTCLVSTCIGHHQQRLRGHSSAADPNKSNEAPGWCRGWFQQTDFAVPTVVVAKIEHVALLTAGIVAALVLNGFLAGFSPPAVLSLFAVASLQMQRID